MITSDLFFGFYSGIGKRSGLINEIAWGLSWSKSGPGSRAEKKWVSLIDLGLYFNPYKQGFLNFI